MVGFSEHTTVHSENRICCGPLDWGLWRADFTVDSPAAHTNAPSLSDSGDISDPSKPQSAEFADFVPPFDCLGYTPMTVISMLLLLGLGNPFRKLFASRDWASKFYSDYRFFEPSASAERGSANDTVSSEQTHPGVSLERSKGSPRPSLAQVRSPQIPMQMTKSGSGQFGKKRCIVYFVGGVTTAELAYIDLFNSIDLVEITPMACDVISHCEVLDQCKLP